MLLSVGIKKSLDIQFGDFHHFFGGGLVTFVNLHAQAAI
jgi:hypothetical protein